MELFGSTPEQAEAWFNVLWKVIIGGLLGSAATAIPLYARIRRLHFEFRGAESKQDKKDRIDHEAEWKRIIEFRDTEMSRLRERDDQQEKKIAELYQMNVECQKSEARLTERIRHLEEQNKNLLDKILILERRQ